MSFIGKDTSQQYKTDNLIFQSQNITHSKYPENEETENNSNKINDSDEEKGCCFFSSWPCGMDELCGNDGPCQSNLCFLFQLK
jgi:hypothetical protein